LGRRLAVRDRRRRSPHTALCRDSRTHSERARSFHYLCAPPSQVRVSWRS
jgi:hypothetical protein